MKSVALSGNLKCIHKIADFFPSHEWAAVFRQMDVEQRWRIFSFMFCKKSLLITLLKTIFESHVPESKNEKRLVLNECLMVEEEDKQAQCIFDLIVRTFAGLELPKVLDDLLDLEEFFLSNYEDREFNDGKISKELHEKVYQMLVKVGGKFKPFFHFIAQLDIKHYLQAVASNEVHLPGLFDEPVGKVQSEVLADILEIPENIFALVQAAIKTNKSLDKLFCKHTFMLRGNKALKTELSSRLRIKKDDDGMYRLLTTALQSHLLQQRSSDELITRFRSYNRTTEDVKTLIGKCLEINNQPNNDLKNYSEINLIRKVDLVVRVMCENPLLISNAKFQEVLVKVFNGVLHSATASSVKHHVASFLWDYFATKGVDLSSFLNNFPLKGPKLFDITSVPYTSISTLLDQFPKKVVKGRLYHNFAYILLAPYMRVINYSPTLPDELLIHLPQIIPKFLADKNISAPYRHAMRLSIARFVNFCAYRNFLGLVQKILGPYWNFPLIIESLELLKTGLIGPIAVHPQLMISPLPLSALLSRPGKAFLFDNIINPLYDRRYLIDILEEGGLDDADLDLEFANDLYAFLVEALVHAPEKIVTEKSIREDIVFQRLQFLFDPLFKMDGDGKPMEDKDKKKLSMSIRMDKCATHRQITHGMVKAILQINVPHAYDFLIHVLYQHYNRLIDENLDEEGTNDDMTLTFTPLSKWELIPEEDMDEMPDITLHIPSPNSAITENLDMLTKGMEKMLIASNKFNAEMRKLSLGKEDEINGIPAKQSAFSVLPKKEAQNPLPPASKAVVTDLSEVRKRVAAVSVKSSKHPKAFQTKNSLRKIVEKANLSTTKDNNCKVQIEPPKQEKSTVIAKPQNRQRAVEEESEFFESSFSNSSITAKKPLENVTALTEKIDWYFKNLNDGTCVPKSSLKPGTHELLLKHANEKGFPFLLEESFYDFLIGEKSTFSTQSELWEEAKSKVPLKTGKTRLNLWVPVSFKSIPVAKGAAFASKIESFLEGKVDLRNRLCSRLQYSLQGSKPLVHIMVRTKAISKPMRAEVQSGTLFIPSSVNTQNLLKMLTDFLTLQPQIAEDEVIEEMTIETENQLESLIQEEAKSEEKVDAPNITFDEELIVDPLLQNDSDSNTSTTTTTTSTCSNTTTTTCQTTTTTMLPISTTSIISTSTTTGNSTRFPILDDEDFMDYEGQLQEITCHGTKQTERIIKLIAEKQEFCQVLRKCNTISTADAFAYSSAQNDIEKLEQMICNANDMGSVELIDLEALIIDADYVALDFELTGVNYGMDEFPNGFLDCKRSVSENSIVQLGLMLMKRSKSSEKLLQEDSGKSIWRIPICMNGNTDDSIWRKNSLDFLIKNGFDHLAWKVQCLDYKQLDIIWAALLVKPLITHNGLIDVLHLLKAAGRARELESLQTIDEFNEYLTKCNMNVFDTKVLYNRTMPYLRDSLFELSSAVIPSETLSAGSAHDASYDAFLTGHLCRFTKPFDVQKERNVLLETKTSSPTSPFASLRNSNSSSPFTSLKDSNSSSPFTSLKNSNSASPYASLKNSNSSSPYVSLKNSNSASPYVSQKNSNSSSPYASLRNSNSSQSGSTNRSSSPLASSSSPRSGSRRASPSIDYEASSQNATLYATGNYYLHPSFANFQTNSVTNNASPNSTAALNYHFQQQQNSFMNPGYTLPLPMYSSYYSNAQEQFNPYNATVEWPANYTSTPPGYNPATNTATTWSTYQPNPQEYINTYHLPQPGRTNGQPPNGNSHRQPHQNRYGNTNNF